MEIVSNLFQLNIKSHWGNSNNLFLNLCLVRSWVKKFFLSISSFLCSFLDFFLPVCLVVFKLTKLIGSGQLPHELVLNPNSGRSWVNSLFMSISYFFFINSSLDVLLVDHDVFELAKSIASHRDN